METSHAMVVVEVVGRGARKAGEWVVLEEAGHEQHSWQGMCQDLETKERSEFREPLQYDLRQCESRFS